jgi:LCP family protein required for cell wall assembly
MTRQPQRVRTDSRSVLAALLSFLFPGLGQAYNREGGVAWLLALPVVALVALAVVTVSIGSSRLLVHLLDQRFLISLLVLDGVLLAWRLVAIVQAHGHRERPSPRRWTTYATAAILVVTVAMHALPGWYAIAAVDTLGAVGQGGGGGGSDDLNDAFGGIGITVPQPSAVPDSTRQRINILLVGIDWKPGRGEHLTDTMLVVSLDRRTGRSAMISIPRDLYGAKLPDGRVYNAKLNSLLIIATSQPRTYPLGGVGTLKGTVGGLLGIQIDYIASINLLGFKQAVDSIGGVDVTVTRAIRDPTYTNEYDRKTGFFISAGRHHMDGHTALGYVRSRKGAGDSDFTRAARQQEVLAAIRAKLTAGNLVTALPSLLDAVKRTVSTDVPTDQIPILAQAIQDADLDHVERAVVQPPLVHSARGPGGASILVPDFAAILALGQRLMAEPPTTAAGVIPTPAIGP